MNDVDKTLQERSNTHGSYIRVASTAQGIKNHIRARRQSLSSDALESLDMIATKMARIIEGNPDEPDHWKDIAGYATLVYNRLTQEK